MTPKELRALADKLEQEEENRIYKIGFLKEDYYVFLQSYRYHCISFQKSWAECKMLNRSQVDSFIQEFSNNFQLALPKGTKFICYKSDNTEMWCDDVNYGIEDRNSQWAQRYLENIQDVK